MAMHCTCLFNLPWWERTSHTPMSLIENDFKMLPTSRRQCGFPAHFKTSWRDFPFLTLSTYHLFQYPRAGIFWSLFFILKEDLWKVPPASGTENPPYLTSNILKHHAFKWITRHTWSVCEVPHGPISLYLCSLHSWTPVVIYCHYKHQVVIIFEKGSHFSDTYTEIKQSSFS